MFNKNETFIFFASILVSLGGILYGYDIGVIAGALICIKKTIPLTNAQMGLIVGAVLDGALIGTLLAGPIGDRFGRRLLIIVSSFIFIIGVFCILLAQSFAMILFARLLFGMGIGVVSVAVPLYVSEIVSAKDRGKYVTFFQILITFGIVLANCVDLIFIPSNNWRAMFAIVLIPAFILFFGMMFLPETPRWLIANKQNDRALKILKRLRPFSAEEEKNSIEKSLRETKGSWLELVSQKVWKPALLAILISIFNQLTGINSFLQYAPLILKQSGMSSDFLTMMGSTSIAALNFICTLIVIPFIDSKGRRPLLLLGISGVIISEVYLGLVQYFSFSGVFSLIGLLMFIIFFAIGPGVVIWLSIAELFPTRIRGKGMALCLFFHSLTSTIIATFFLSFSNLIGMAETYWLFSLTSMGYFLIVCFFLPETKTKSLEEIQFQFEKKSALLTSEIDQ